MYLCNEKINSRLLSDIIINEHIYNVKIEDYYDKSDWVGCRGCGGLMYSGHICEWCNYISKKEPDYNYKNIRFNIDKEYFPNIESILNSINNKFEHHDTKQTKQFCMIEKFGLYPTSNFEILKNTLIEIGCELNDMDIIRLDLGDLNEECNVTYDMKLATSRKLDLPGAIFEYDVMSKKPECIDVVHVSIKMSTIDIKNNLRKIFESNL